MPASGSAEIEEVDLQQRRRVGEEGDVAAGDRPRATGPPKVLAVAPNTPISAPPQKPRKASSSVTTAPSSSSGSRSSATPSWKV